LPDKRKKFPAFLPYSSAMSEDVVLASKRKSGNNNQEKQVMQHQRK
jgi:hypothetical protein